MPLSTNSAATAERATSPNTLCKACTELGLTRQSFLGGGRPEDPAQMPRTMGTLETMRKQSSWCSLCRLIVQSLREQSTAEGPDVPCRVMLKRDGAKMVVKDGNVEEVTLTRYLHIHWPGHYDSAVILVRPETDYWGSPQFLGRILTSQEGAKVKWIQECYEHCCENHGQDCSINHTDEFEDLRKESYFGVIDLKEMRLVPLPQGERYAALSYTLGGGWDGRKDSDSKDLNGLELPKTFRDTFDLVPQLGIRYLWVDEFCIPNADVRASIVERMHTVYSNASITICAADGKGVDAGLQALHSEAPPKQSLERISDCTLMVARQPEADISDSTWNKRAWTFQERVLSKRCVIFTNGTIFFECQSVTMSESVHHGASAGCSTGLVRRLCLTNKDIKTDPLGAYPLTVEEYTSRQLTCQEDFVTAFKGIGQEICSKLGAELVFCLPNKYLDHALLWRSESAPIRCTEGGSPSWAWCGQRHSRITYRSFENYDWWENHTWIKWYISDGQGRLMLVWDPQMGGNEGGYNCGDKTLTQKIPVPPRGLNQDEFRKTLPTRPFQATVKETTQSRTESQPSLQFRTFSAKFKLSPKEGNSIQVGVRDRHGTLVGLVESVPADYPLKKAEHQFIALSRARGFSEQEVEEWVMDPSLVETHEEWSTYNVLMLAHQKNGACTRAGIGNIFMTSFNSAGVKWEEFVMV